MNIVDNAPVEGLLEVDRTSQAERDLDEDDVAAVAIAEIAVGNVDLPRRVLGDDLELIVLRDMDYVATC